MNENRPVVKSAIIVGSGFSGLAAAIELKKLGLEPVILERAAALGGTWRDNTYPGCACDVPSHLYSFSFAPKHDWSRTYSGAAEIRAYLERVADDFDLRKHVLFGREVVEASWNAGQWTVRTKNGDALSAPILVMATGPLSTPALPPLPGIETFAGPQFHSAQWRHDVDLAGKRVAVIGTGASAIQLVPKIQPLVAKLSLIQRTPPWIIPRWDRAYSSLEKAAFRRVPGLRAAYRSLLYWFHEGRILAFVWAPPLMDVVEWATKHAIADAIEDRALRERVTPKYRPGCKRILISSDYFPALAKPNVDVIAGEVASVGERSVTLADGRVVDADVIVWSTGFDVHGAHAKLPVRGRDGVTLSDAWRATGEQAYLGTMVAGFPNLFLMAGPNTGIGHSSLLVMIEAQARWMREAIALGGAAIEPKPDVQARFNAWLRGRSAGTVWESGCRSWYLDSAGRNTAVWPGSLTSFRRRTASVRESDLAVSR